MRSGILDSIHAFGASTVGGWFLALIAVVVAGSTALIVSRLDDLRSERRIDSLLSREAIFLLNNLVLVGLCFVDLLGHVLPADLRGGHGRQGERRAALVRPLHGAAGARAGAALRIGPLLAWRRVTLAQDPARRSRSRSRSRRRDARGARRCSPTRLDSPPSLVMFALRRLHDRRGGARVRARRPRRGGRSAGEAAPARARVDRAPQPPPLRRLRRARRDRGAAARGGGVVGLQHQRDVRLRPGQSARVGGYEVRTCGRPSGVSNEKLDFGAVLDVRKDGKRVALLHPSRNYYPSLDGAMGPIGRFFGGESTSEVGLQRGHVARHVDRDAAGPRASSTPPHPRRQPPASPTARREVQAIAIAALAQRYVSKAPPADLPHDRQPDGDLDLDRRPDRPERRAHRAVAVGARGRARRVTSLYAARLGRELSRA